MRNGITFLLVIMLLLLPMTGCVDNNDADSNEISVEVSESEETIFQLNSELNVLNESITTLKNGWNDANTTITKLEQNISRFNSTVLMLIQGWAASNQTLQELRLGWEFSNNSQSDTVIISCLLYTSPSPRDLRRSRMPSSA